MREAKYGNLLEEDDEKGRMLQGPMEGLSLPWE